MYMKRNRALFRSRDFLQNLSLGFVNDANIRSNDALFASFTRHHFWGGESYFSEINDIVFAINQTIVWWGDEGTLMSLLKNKQVMDFINTKM